MPRQPTVLSHLFPRDGVQLGRLVSNMAAPHNDYYPPSQIRYVKGDIHSITGKDFLDMRSKNTNSKLSVVINSVLSALFGKNIDVETKIADTICITYFLDNSEAKFKKLCDSVAAKKWFETTYKKRKQVYMVTGIQTITDANLWLQGNTESEISASATAPVAKAAGTPAPVPAVNVSLMASHLAKRHRESGFVAENEQIYAIQYRKVKLRLRDFLKETTADTLGESMLEDGCRWEVMWKTMGAGNDQVITMLEVFLEHETHVELQEGLESCEVEGQTVFFLPVAESA